jgi:hypothetical protein
MHSGVSVSEDLRKNILAVMTDKGGSFDQSAELLANSLSRQRREGSDQHDANLDIQKLNLAIRVFCDFPICKIRDFGREWLARWQSSHGDALWFQEWHKIVNEFSDDELIDVLLSDHEESVRRRISMPFSTMLAPELVLEIKRRGTPF